MKKLLLSSIILISLLFACKKENNLLDTGIITSVDTRECACCGGWFIDINDSLWLFNELPASSSLDLVNETFPIVVEVEWQKKVNPCLSEEILISYIKKK